MTADDLALGVAAVQRIYKDARTVPAAGTVRPLRVAPVPIPTAFWGGGITRLLVVFDLANHETTRPRGLCSSDATFATSLQVAIPILRSSPQPRLTSSRRRTATGSGWPMSAWDPVRSR